MLQKVKQGRAPKVGGGRGVLALGAALVVGLTVLLSACSSSSTTSSTTTTKVGQTVTNVKVAPGTAQGFVGASKDATNTSCTNSGNSWTSSGRVTNPTTATVDYRIYTSFLNKVGGTLGLLQTDVTGVSAGKQQAWSGQLTIAATGLHCVLRVERYPAGSVH